MGILKRDNAGKPLNNLVYREALIIFHARYWALSSVVRAADS